MEPKVRISMEEARKLLKYISQGYKIPKIIYDTVWEVAKREIEDMDKAVLIKRDPDVESRRIQGARVKLISGNVMEIPPPIVGGFGADFDGDSSHCYIMTYVLKPNNEYEPMIIHISEFQKLHTLKLIETKQKDNGVIVENYKVLDNVYVDAIDPNTGNIQKKKINNWSIHKNLKMYSIERKPKIYHISNIRDLWVSDNHSLISLDLNDMNVKKITPLEIIENNKNYFLIRNKNNKNTLTHPFKKYINLKKESNVSESEMGFFLGCWLGDGYISYNKNDNGDKYYSTIGLTNSNRILNESWGKIAEKLTDNIVTVNEDRKINYDKNWFSKNDGSMAKIALRSKTIDLHLANEIQSAFSKGCEDKKLPRWLINVNTDFIKGLFAGYLISDGTFNNNGYISFTSKSEKLIKDFKFILAYKFNINSSIFKECKKYILENNGKRIACKNESEYRYYWKLDIKVSKSNKSFFEDIVLLLNDDSLKQQKLKDSIKIIKENEPDKLTFIPYQLIKNMSPKDRLEIMGITNDLTHRIKKSNYCQKSIIIPDNIIDNSDLTESCKNLLKMQNNDEIEFIPCELLDITYDPDIIVGYDFTIEDYYTFTTSDGIFLFDSMAIIAPLSEEAQKEIKTKMITSDTNTSLSDINFKLSKESVIGLFTATYLEDVKKPIINLKDTTNIEKMEYGQRIKCQNPKKYGEIIETTVGRYQFNTKLPKYIPYINVAMNGKAVEKLLKKLNAYNKNDFMDTINRLDKFGFDVSTLYPLSMSIDMLELSPKLLELKNKFAKEKDVDKQESLFKEMRVELREHLKKSSPDIYMMMESGALKDVDQLVRVMVAKGLTTDYKGNVLPPISSSIAEGYTSREMFDIAPSARKGLIAKAINTSKGGYAYRKFIYIMGSVMANKNVADCGTKRYMKIKLTNELFSRMSGRYVVNEKGTIIPINENMVGKIINLRSPIYCKNTEICKICYGDLIHQINSKHVGIIAAQECCSIAESIMKCSNGLVQYNNKLYAFEDFWNVVN